MAWDYSTFTSFKCGDLRPTSRAQASCLDRLAKHRRLITLKTEVQKRNNTFEQNITVSHTSPDRILGTADGTTHQSTTEESDTGQRAFFHLKRGQASPPGGSAHETLRHLIPRGSKKKIHPDQFGFISGMYSRLDTGKPTDKIYHINRIKEQRPILLSMTRGKGHDKSQQQFRILKL